jgi:hypothetical protein
MLLENNILQTKKQPYSRRFFRGVLLLVVGFLSAFLASAALAQNTRYTSKRLELPRSALNAPYESAVYVGAHGQVGGGFKHDQGQPGWGGFIMFRPARAANFFNFLYDWNSSLILQADYQRVAPDARIKSADVVIRRYFADLGGSGRRVSPFLGVGIGASSALRPPGQSPRMSKYWSWLVEIGQEWDLDGRCMVAVKGQYRGFRYQGFDFTSWSVALALGLPLPW